MGDVRLKHLCDPLELIYGKTMAYIYPGGECDIAVPGFSGPGNFAPFWMVPVPEKIGPGKKNRSRYRKTYCGAPSLKKCIFETPYWTDSHLDKAMTLNF